MNLKVFKILLLYIIVISSYTLIFFDHELILSLRGEDGVIENLGAVFFLIASGLFLAAYISSSGSGVNLKRFHFRRNTFYLLLGILFFICFGEEISWGQRIFNWETPNFLKAINPQGETNIHNIWIFEYRNPDGSPRSFMAMLLHMNRLFAVFGFLFLVVIPGANRFSKKLGQFFKDIALPIAPLWISGLFLANAILIHIEFNYLNLPFKVRMTVNEIKESNYAFIFAIFA